jgi:hypothetical protein
MEPWIETYRGSVAPWECDVTEHFTIAYYFDRIAVAEAALGRGAGAARPLRAGGFTGATTCASRANCAPARVPHRERGDRRRRGGGLRLGHRVVDSVTGEAITWFDVHWDGSRQPPSEADRRLGWARVRAAPSPAIFPG